MKAAHRLGLGLASAVTAMLLVAAPLPAQAAKESVKLTGLTVKDVVVGKDVDGTVDHCEDILVTARFKLKGGVQHPRITYNFYSGKREWATGFAVQGRNTLDEWCAGDSPLGKQRLVTQSLVAVYDKGELVRKDTHRTTFNVRTQSTAAVSAERLSGQRVKLSIEAKNLSIKKNDYKPYAAKKVAVQVKSGTKWKTLKKVDLNGKGAATLTVKRSAKANYRVVVPTTATKTGVTTKVVSK